MAMHMSATYDYEKRWFLAEPVMAGLERGCEWIESESELPSTFMVLSLCVRADFTPPNLSCIKVSL